MDAISSRISIVSSYRTHGYYIATLDPNMIMFLPRVLTTHLWVINDEPHTPRYVSNKQLRTLLAPTTPSRTTTPIACRTPESPHA